MLLWRGSLLLVVIWSVIQLLASTLAGWHHASPWYVSLGSQRVEFRRAKSSLGGEIERVSLHSSK